MKYLNYQKGYTLLFSMIVSSVILSIAAFILSSSRRQFILSAVSRDSTTAVYAADSGIQCVVDAYNNHRLVVEDNNGVPVSGSISCAGAVTNFQFGQITPSSSTYDSGMNLDDNVVGPKDYNIYQSTAPVQVNFPDNTCARIMVTIGFDLPNHKHKTIIDSRGYNFKEFYPCLNEGPVNSRSVERAIRLQYFE